MITEVVIHAFRGIPDERRFPLRQISFLSGRNGLGKTTFFDAIDWCLFGEASRLGNDVDSIRNLYSMASNPSVEIELALGGRQVRVRRTLGGTASRVSVDGSDTTERELLDLFITDRQVFPPHSQDTASRVRGLIYLKQAQIRSIVSAESEDARTELFQALLGLPHVSTVRASLRKIAEGLETRMRRTARDLEQLDTDLADPAIAAARDTSTEIERLATETLARARLVLGSQLPEIRASLELQNIARAALSTIRAKRSERQDTLSTVDRLEAEFQHLSEEIARRRGTLGEAERSSAEAHQAYTAARAHRATADLELTSAREQRDAASRAREAARREATRRAVLARLQAEVAESSAARNDAAGLQDSTNLQLAAAKSRATLVMARLGALRERSAAASARKERRARLSVVEAETVEVRTRLNEARATFQQRRSLVLQLQEQLHNVDAEQDNAAAAYEASVAGLEARERAASLAHELRRLAAELALTECPTCGIPFDSNRDLLDHIDLTQGRYTESSQETAAVRHRLDDLRSRRDLLQAQLFNAEASLTEKEGDVRVLESRLTQFEDETYRIMAQDNHTEDEPGYDTLVEQLEQAESAVSDATATQRSLEGELTSADARLSDAMSDLADAERRLAAIGNREARPATSDQRALEQQLQTELRLGTAVQNVGAREEVAEEAARVERQAEELQGDSLVRTEAARSAVRRAEGRLELTSAELVETMQNVAGPEGDRQTITRMVDELTAKERELRVLLESIDELLDAEAQGEAMQRLKYLRTSKENAVLELQGLERAKTRFSSVAAGLTARANSEERIALVQQRSAIQECFRALLPHKHLDEIDIDPENGAILISDYLLQRDLKKVKAYRYLSTGQANALAVSMFVGIALRQRIALLDFLLVDEPVQNLDDVHFLAFMSLIKRVALDRQVIFSTADANIAEIFRRQMKSTWHRYPEDYVEYEWQEFAPLQGPTVTPRL